MKILIVEDDQALKEAITIALSDDYEVTTIDSYIDALQYQSYQQFDIILLDINLPDGDGRELAKRISQMNHVPFLFITANDLEKDIIQGYELGCQDYITKPFSIQILKKKIEVILRNRNQQEMHYLYSQHMTLNCDEKKCFVDQEECILTAQEFMILQVLMENQKKVMTREILEDYLDKDGEGLDKNSLSVYIKRLRDKIHDEKPYHYIYTVFGLGYMFKDE